MTAPTKGQVTSFACGNSNSPSGQDILKTIRVIIYARVSSQKQLENKEENSIQSQIHCCRKFCRDMLQKDERWEIVEIISDDGMTGRNDKRDGINRVRELTASGKVDVVLVYGLNRAFRNSQLGQELDAVMKQNGVRLVSTTQPGGTDTANEKFVRSIFWALAELGSNIISEDVQRSIGTRAQQGLTHGGVPKPGYGIKDGRLFIVPEDAAVVLEIFNCLVVSGMTPSEIVRDLNDRKVRTRKRTSKNGKVTGGHRFRIEQVLTILRDPLYKGVLVHDGAEHASAVEAIVSAEVWEKAQVALDRRPRRQAGVIQERDKHFMPLKGKIRCGCCNAALKPSFSSKKKADGSVEKYFYYLCSKHEKQGNESTCKIRRIPARLLESLVMEAFGAIAANPTVANRLIEKAPKAKTTRIRKLAKERQVIRKHLKALDEEVDTITRQILEFARTVVGEKLREKVDALTQRKQDLIMEEVRLNREIDSLKSDSLTTDALQEALAHFAEAINCLSEDEQRELYRLLFRSVTVHEGGAAKDPADENTRRSREARKHLSVEVRLRSEAVETLLGTTMPIGGRKSGFIIPLEIAHCRKKPFENCAILAPIHKECGHKAPKMRKRPHKTEHEIHRAIRWKREMEEMGVGQNEFARGKRLSYPAVAQAMRWLKLTAEAQILLKSATDQNLIRKLGRRTVFPLLEHEAKKQAQVIREIMNSTC